MRIARICLVVLAALAAPAAADVAPGRVVFGVGLEQPVANVDAAGAGVAVALPDGGAVLAAAEFPKGIVLARITAGGSLDPSFGSGGVAHVAVPEKPAALGLPTTFSPLQIARQPDGRLLIAGMGAARSRYELPQMVVLRLASSGALDSTFGTGGIARPGFQASCGGSCEPLALQADGAVILTGNTGQVVPGSELDPNGPPPRFQWIVARLTPAGALDQSFGSGGIVEIAGAVGSNGGGSSAAVLPDGRIVVLGRGPQNPLLARLAPSGQPDPSFHAGTPVAPPLSFSFEMLARPDGGADLLGDGKLVRYRADGELDAGFGSGGVVTLGSRGAFEGLLADGDRGVLVHQGSFEPRPAADGDLLVRRLTADGTFDAGWGAAAGRTVTLGFGGGLASLFARLAPRPLPALRQSSFKAVQVVRRADGSLLVAGGVSIVRYTGEGAGHSTGLFAAAALTPALARIPEFGGAAAAPRVRVRVPRQTARVDSRRKRVLVRVTSSAAGLARVQVRYRGRVIAQSLEPVYVPGTATAAVRLTRTGERLLRSGARRRVGVSATLRDILTQEATAGAGGTLR